MKNNINTIKSKLLSKGNLISIKGGYLAIDSSPSEELAKNISGCINTADCSKAVNESKCDNRGTCG